MKKCLPIAFILIITSIYSSCSEEEAEGIRNESLAFISTAVVPNDAKVGEPVTIEVVMFGSSGCASFSRLETEETERNLKVEMYQSAPADAVCTTALIFIEVNIDVVFEEGGTWEIVFSGFDGDIVYPIDISD